MNCGRCGEDISDHHVALINGRVMGDGYTESFFHCPRCDVYMMVLYHDSFSGPDTKTVHGPLSKTRVNPKLQIIARCPEPTNERCTCDAHREYWGELLDT